MTSWTADARPAHELVALHAREAGFPVCVVPWGRDQNDVAQHVVRAGAGRSVPRSKLSVERLRVAIGETIALREGARAIADAFGRLHLG